MSLLKKLSITGKMFIVHTLSTEHPLKKHELALAKWLQLITSASYNLNKVNDVETLFNFTCWPNVYFYNEAVILSSSLFVCFSSGVPAPVTPCSLASAASSPAPGTEQNRPHPSAVPALMMATETKWRQVSRGTSWEATALWGETRLPQRRRRKRRIGFFLAAILMHFSLGFGPAPFQLVPRPALRWAEDFQPTVLSSPLCSALIQPTFDC